MSSARVPFVIGVTGKMKIPGYEDSTTEVEKMAPAVRQVYDRIHAILDWIRHDPKPGEPSGRLDSESGRFFPHEVGRNGWQSLGLGNTPIVVLTSLAPGADTIVAEAVLDYGKQLKPGLVTVRAPLPFPVDLYAQSTTFHPDRLKSPVPSGVGRSTTPAERRFRHLCDRIRGQKGFLESRDLFCVGLHPKRDGDPARDRDCEHRSNIRFRAAGEYIASASHFLLAVYGKPVISEAEQVEAPTAPVDFHDIRVPGCEAIVHAKLEGLSFELLANPNAFGWADTGSVLRIPIDTKGDGSQECRGELEWMHPRDLKSWGFHETPSFQKDLLRLLGCIPRSEQPATKPKRNSIWEVARPPSLKVALEGPFEWVQSKGHKRDPATVASSALGTEPTPGFYRKENWRKNGHELCRRVVRYFRRFTHLELDPGTGPAALNQETEPPTSAPPAAVLAWIRKMDPIQDGMEHASRVADFLDASRKGLLRSLFVLTLVAAGLLGVYEHWNPIGSHSAGVEESHSETKPPPSVVPTDGKEFFKALLVLGALLSLLNIGRLFHAYRKSDSERSRYDWRALSEGLRIQRAWCIAGVPATVPADYMQRQRGELDWIRSAIQSVVWPTEHWTADFNALNPVDRQTLLSHTRRDWVVDQRMFYRSRASRAERRRHFFHHWGWSLAAAGLLNIVLKFLSSASPWLHEFIHHHFPGISAVMLFLSLSCFALAAYGLRKAREHGPHDQHHDSDPPPSFVAWLFGRPALWGSALLIAVVPYFMAHAIGALEFALLPAAHNWWLILTGLVILGGALALTWSERNFYAEDARRYRAMESLFASANRRLKCLIKAYGRDPRPDRLPEIHDILHQLGREALAEHAEWLILHRIHPLEPFMAG